MSLTSLISLVAGVPATLLCVVGVVLAQSRLPRHSGESLLATLGFALLLLDAVAEIGLRIYLVRSPPVDVLDQTIIAWSIAQRLLFFGALLCLTCAIFAGRRRGEP